MKLKSFLSHFQGVKISGDGYIARCPAHQDRHASMSIGCKDGSILVHCHAGCSTRAILDVLDLSWLDLFTDGRTLGHRAETPKQAKPIGRPRVEVESVDFRPTYESMLATAKSDPCVLEPLADSWSVDVQTLARMGCGASDGIYGVPMHDHGFSMIGVRICSVGGRKWALKGSHNGLFGAVDEVWSKADTLYVTEGVSDTAALLNIGLYAIGRPSCTGGVDLLAKIVRGYNVVIMGDADDPGRAGAESLALHIRRLCRSLRVMYPTVGGDVRGLIAAGAGRDDIEQMAMARRTW